MNMKFYNAALLQLRGKALESLGVVEDLLNNRSSIASDEAVSEIITHTLDLVRYEGAMLTLQQYFEPKPAPHPGPPPSEAVRVTPEMSPTYKKSLEVQKRKEAAEAKAADNE